MSARVASTRAGDSVDWDVERRRWAALRRDVRRAMTAGAREYVASDANALTETPFRPAPSSVPDELSLYPIPDYLKCVFSPMSPDMEIVAGEMAKMLVDGNLFSERVYDTPAAAGPVGGETIDTVMEVIAEQVSAPAPVAAPAAHRFSDVAKLVDVPPPARLDKLAQPRPAPKGVPKAKLKIKADDLPVGMESLAQGWKKP